MHFISKDNLFYLLSELKQDYPAAYIVPHNDFYKVRIPDIKTSEQGHECGVNPPSVCPPITPNYR